MITDLIGQYEEKVRGEALAREKSIAGLREALAQKLIQQVRQHLPDVLDHQQGEPFFHPGDDEAPDWVALWVIHPEVGEFFIMGSQGRNNTFLAHLAHCNGWRNGLPISLSSKASLADTAEAGKFFYDLHQQRLNEAAQERRNKLRAAKIGLGLAGAGYVEGTQVYLATTPEQAGAAYRVLKGLDPEREAEWAAALETWRQQYEQEQVKAAQRQAETKRQAEENQERARVYRQQLRAFGEAYEAWLRRFAEVARANLAELERLKEYYNRPLQVIELERGIIVDDAEGREVDTDFILVVVLPDGSLVDGEGYYHKLAGNKVSLWRYEPHVVIGQGRPFEIRPQESRAHIQLDWVSMDYFRTDDGFCIAGPIDTRIPFLPTVPPDEVKAEIKARLQPAPDGYPAELEAGLLAYDAAEVKQEVSNRLMAELGVVVSWPVGR